MNWIEKIRHHFYQSALTKQLQDKKIQRRVINLTDAGSIGILYDFEDRAVVQQVIQELQVQHKTVESLCFFGGKEKEKPQMQNVFTKTDVAWQNVPKTELAKAFSDKKFDLLLCLFTNENLPLEFISATSGARWRVGVFRESKTLCYDMMVNVGEKKEVKYLWEQAQHFLNNIKYDSK